MNIHVYSNPYPISKLLKIKTKGGGGWKASGLSCKCWYTCFKIQLTLSLSPLISMRVYNRKHIYISRAAHILPIYNFFPSFFFNSIVPDFYFLWWKRYFIKLREMIQYKLSYLRALNSERTGGKATSKRVLFFCLFLRIKNSWMAKDFSYRLFFSIWFYFLQ